MRVPGQTRQMPGQPLDLRWQVGQRLFLVEDVQRRQADGGGQRVAGVGVAVIEGPAGGVGAEESPPNLVARQGRRHRQVAAGQALAQAQQIGADRFVLASEQLAGPAEPRGDFVGNQQNVVLARQLPHTAQVAGRVREHAGRALNQRLDHDRRQVLVMCVQGPLQLVQVVPAGGRASHTRRQPVTIRCGQADDFEQQRPEHLVKPLHAAHADAT